MDSLYRAAFDAPSDELGFVSMYRPVNIFFQSNFWRSERWVGSVPMTMDFFLFFFYRAVFDVQKEKFSSVPMNMDNLYRAAFDA